MAKENSHTASACQRAHAVSVQTRGFPVIILADEGWFKMTKITLWVLYCCTEMAARGQAALKCVWVTTKC